MHAEFKKYTSGVAALLISVLAMAQENGLINTREISVGGLKIIFRKVPKEVVTATLFIRGGVANISDSTQGIEPMALGLAIRGGTKTMDKNQFSTLADRLGTRFSFNA